jgi:phosphoesterase RecJ-like protein
MITSHTVTPLIQQQQAAKKLLDDAKRLLIIPHTNVDPDGISSALSSYLLFTALGKECTVICPDILPESLKFLPGFDKLKQEIEISQDFFVNIDCSKGFEIGRLQQQADGQSVNIIITPKKGSLTEDMISLKEGPLPFDLIVVVDSAELKLLGSFYENHKELFEKVPVLNIDHHISNSKFGQTQLINPEASSATEVLYDWFCTDSSWKTQITPDIATLLLAGLITDTRSFQNPNTTPRSLEVAAELLDLGARQQEIIKFIYKTKPLSTLKLWGRALNHIQINEKERIVWSTISKEDLDEMQGSSKETHGIIDELLTTIPDADVCILFTEIEEGGLKASMRSTDAIDVSALAGKLFGGGGHARAAGFRISGYDNFQLKTVECIQKIIDELHGKSDDTAAETPPAPSPPPVSPPSTDDGSSIDVLQKLSE